MQPNLFEDLPVTAPDRVVNVAQVRQLSPFRYPGGKTWLVPHVQQWLLRLEYRPKELVEPFAGGGIISLTAAHDHLVDHVTMVELDEQVASVWRAILEGDVHWLVQRILSFELRTETVQEALSQPPQTTEEQAFRTILRNRVSHGGIMAPGAGLLKYGESGKGIKSRWYPQTLKRRILAIAAMRDRITFVEGDGIAVLRQRAGDKEVAYFIDPPYTAGGKNSGQRLYTHSTIDHARLFDIATSLAGDFLITYEDAIEVRELARRHNLDMALVAMQGRRLARMKELLIGNDLGWLQQTSTFGEDSALPTSP